ncbi:MAG: FG-GAP repeat domain-containing protein [Planctomycetota bacterium]|jgi:hypothetical protein
MTFVADTMPKSPGRAISIIMITLLCAVAASGCGLAGAAAVGAAAGGGGDDGGGFLPPNGVPTVFVTTPSRQVGDVSITVKLVDVDSDNCTVTLLYGVYGAAATNTVTLAASSPPLADRQSSPAGTDHVFVWNSIADIGAGYRTGVTIAVAASDGKDNSAEQTTAGFVVGNNAPQALVQTPPGVQSGDVALVYTAIDNSSDMVDLEAEFRLNSSSTWIAATPLTGIPVTSIITAPDNGIQHVFVWDSLDNVGGVGSAVSSETQLRVRLTDAYDIGNWAMTSSFTINNNQPPVVQFRSVGDVSVPYLMGVIPIHYRLLDAEGDVCDVVVEGSIDGSAFFTLEEFPGGYDNRLYSQGRAGLSASASGDDHVFLWYPYSSNVPLSAGVYVRVTANDAYNAGNPALIFTTKQLGYRKNGEPQVENTLADVLSPSAMASGDFNNDGIVDLISKNTYGGWDNCTIWPGKSGSLPTDADGMGIAAGGSAKAIGVGDFDNDGISDFVIVRESTDTCWVYAGKNGSFPTADAPRVLQTGAGSISVAVGDFSGDGIDDFAIGAEDELVVKCYISKSGDLPYNSSSIDLAVGNYSRTIAAADLNNDGFDDLISLNINSDNCTLYAGADGGPDPASTYPLPTNDGPWDVAVGDFDGDGLNDFAISCALANNIIIYRGKDGSFPGIPDGSTLEIGDRPQSIGAADFNGDGIDDIVTTNMFTHSVTVFPGQSGSMPQNGQEKITDVTNFGIGQIIADYNGDGLDDLAVIAGSLRFFPGMSGLFFTEADTVILLPQASPFGRTSGDFNGDGITDLAIMTNGGVVLLSGQGSNVPKPGERHVYGVGDWPFDSVVCDINSDGIDDIVTADTEGYSLTVNPGQPGTFPSNLDAVMLPTGHWPIMLQTGDFNADGIDDVVAQYGNYGDWTGLFVPGRSGVPSLAGAAYVALPGNSAAILAGDFNNDGIDDFLAGASAVGTIELMFYPGKSGSLPANGEETSLFGGVVSANVIIALARGDFNADGLVDVATADYYNNTTTILPGQPGAFPVEAQNTVLPLVVNPSHIAVGDFNCDGLDDLAFGHETPGIMMYPGGDGVMPQAFEQWFIMYPWASACGGLSVGDFNADGIDDLVVVHHGAGQNATICYGILGALPSGAFVTTAPTGGSADDVTALDINSDGIDDFVTADGSGLTNTIYLGGPDEAAIPHSRITLPSGEFPHALDVADVNADGLKTFISIDRDGCQVVMFKRFLCSPCLVFPLTPQAVERSWSSDYWQISLSIPLDAVSENEIAYMMHVDYLDLPKRVGPGACYRHASTAVKFMPETLALGGGGVEITMPILPGISQADIDEAETKGRMRAFRWEREFDNGDGTFGRLSDITGKIIDFDTDERTVTILIDRFGVFQLAMEY